MYLFTVVGHTGQGKSTWTKKFVSNTNHYVFDVNNEYGYLPDDNVIRPQMRNTTLNMATFVKNAAMLKGTNIVFEDATGFLRGRQSEDFARLLIGKRHSKNNYILLFHSVNRVPPEIMEMTNFLILFKTIDNVRLVEQKFGNNIITNAVEELKQQPQFSLKQIRLI